MTAAYYAYSLMHYPYRAEIHQYHILYQVDFTNCLELYFFVAYLLGNILPFFVSSVKKTNVLGVLMFLACLVSAVFFIQYQVSIWCFFAALLSMGVYWVLKSYEK